MLLIGEWTKVGRGNWFLHCLPTCNEWYFTKKIVFLKKEPIPATFCLFSSFSHYNLNNKNWKKRRWRAWDSNSGPQNGRRRHNRRAIVAPPPKKNLLASWKFDVMVMSTKIRLVSTYVRLCSKIWHLMSTFQSGVALWLTMTCNIQLPLKLYLVE